MAESDTTNVACVCRLVLTAQARRDHDLVACYERVVAQRDAAEARATALAGALGARERQQMATYTIDDFRASLERVRIAREHIARVLAAWGRGYAEYAEWSGGFLLQLQDGRCAYLAGWCDSSGWGCQDGADIAYVTPPATLDMLRLPPGVDWLETPVAAEWDIEPADLNLWLATGQGP